MKESDKKYWRKFIERYNEYLNYSFENQTLFDLFEFFQFQLNIAKAKPEEIVVEYLLHTKKIYEAISEFIKEEEFEICAGLKEIIDSTRYNLFDWLSILFPDVNLGGFKDLVADQLYKQSEYYLNKGNIINPNGYEEDIV